MRSLFTAVRGGRKVKEKMALDKDLNRLSIVYPSYASVLVAPNSAVAEHLHFSVPTPGTKNWKILDRSKVVSLISSPAPTCLVARCSGCIGRKKSMGI
jgi:hypothetical protein